MYILNQTDTIVFSQDGVNVDRAIKKANITDVSGVFVPGSVVGGLESNPSMPYNRQAQCNVEISLSDGSKVPFDSQKVSNQPWGFPNLGTQATLNLAVTTINGWL